MIKIIKRRVRVTSDIGEKILIKNITYFALSGCIYEIYIFGELRYITGIFIKSTKNWSKCEPLNK